MDEENEKDMEKITTGLINRKFFLFPQFSNKKNEIEYNVLRNYNAKEYIYIHLVVSLLVILIEFISFSFNLSKKDATVMEIFVFIFSVLNCIMHIVVIIKFYFFSPRNIYSKSLFIGYIIINQIFQFLSLYFFTKKNKEFKEGSIQIVAYNNKLSLYIHFFIDSVCIICLPTLKYIVSVIFMILYASGTTILILLTNFKKEENASELISIYILSVVLLMFIFLRYLAEKRNRILLYIINEFLLNNYKADIDTKTQCSNENESISVNIDKENDKTCNNSKTLFAEKSMIFKDFTINACYKDFCSVSYFLKKISVSNNDILEMEKNKENTGAKKTFDEIKKRLNESDILQIAYEADVLKNIKKINSDEIGRNWDYSFIDSEYGKSTLVILEVGYHLISPYIENNEDKKHKLKLFLLLINSMYFPNPYHNANHGATVCHLSKCLAHITDFDKHLNKTYMICYLIASIAHDVGHPGKTNAYLSETNHILSIRYNDMSILENYHCSITFSILQLIGFDFLINNEDTKLVDKNNYANMRKFIIELIISTDMKLHFEYLDIFKKRKRSENFDVADRDAINMGTINIKLADIGHTCLKWRDHAKWTMLVSEEFFSQKKVEELYRKNKDTDPNNFNGILNDTSIDDSMIFNYENIYINYSNNINNINEYHFSYIKLNFIHNHDFVKSIPSTQVYFFEIIVMPLIQELQSIEQANKEITHKVLHNLNVNLKTWKLLEKNINLFYNTDKMKGTDYYKNLEKQQLLRGVRLLDIGEEDVMSLTKNIFNEKSMEKTGENKKKEKKKKQ
ncbi:3',5'-cyclic-nucleotide phosphodiesterase [Plasmodium vinckei petteri]|uniref:Phosphodiesterase n=1 Tax=Plasmodium vinckei petteri TaxID=138298 RepID=W7ANT4_PLAVN|nr:3',5'-cyclic-nucleotide phosphodiesterase [Plasmodium vinckei petteri]CAD2111859.1 phosphodiesterase delta, putative [Plasmodium vinckei petteri]